MTEDENDPLSHIGFEPVGRPERHRRRDVEDHPDSQGLLGHVHPYMWFAPSRGRAGVDQAHIVAWLVGSYLDQLRADPEKIEW